MTGRFSLVIAGIAIVTLAAAFNVLKADTASNTEVSGDTLALAPISLGNPTAAATLNYAHPTAPIEQAMLATPLAQTYQQTVAVGKGDTLARVLDRAGVSRTDAHKTVVALSDHFNLRRLLPGQEITLSFQADRELERDEATSSPDQFIGLSIEPDYKSRIVVQRIAEDAFAAEKVEKTLSEAPAGAMGDIQSSLYVAARQSDVPVAVIAQMIKLLSWDVDFQRDIRQGDSFEVLYNRVQDENGKTVSYGEVDFVALTMSGVRTTVYRFENDDAVDYFDEKGKASRKALMRTPIDGARLSSTFGNRRHPILGYNRMHKGVDFAAPTGTPIYAAGNGTVTFAGRKGGFGKYIRLRHNGTYETAYAHLHGYAKGIRNGARVNQGQIIGYVGTTGRSTGPHLHYEVLRDGRQVNPLKIKMPSGKSLKGNALAKFQDHRKDIDSIFRSHTATEVASAAPE